MYGEDADRRDMEAANKRRRMEEERAAAAAEARRREREEAAAAEARARAEAAEREAAEARARAEAAEAEAEAAAKAEEEAAASVEWGENGGRVGGANPHDFWLPDASCGPGGDPTPYYRVQLDGPLASARYTVTWSDDGGEQAQRSTVVTQLVRGGAVVAATTEPLGAAPHGEGAECSAELGAAHVVIAQSRADDELRFLLSAGGGTLSVSDFHVSLEFTAPGAGNVHAAAGTLHAEVLSASFAKALEPEGSMDPFVSLWLEPQPAAGTARHPRGRADARDEALLAKATAATGVVSEGGQEVEWTEAHGRHLELALRGCSVAPGDDGRRVVVVEAHDEDLGGAHLDFIGWGVLEVHAAVAGGTAPQLVTVPLVDRRGDNKAGAVHLRCWFEA